MLVLVFVAMIVIAGVVSLLAPAAPPKLPKLPPKPLPNPNGFDTFVQAGSMIPEQLPVVDKMSHDELASLVEAKSNALQLARTGLGQECQVSLQSSNFVIHLVAFSCLKQLALTFEAEGRLAEMENRLAGAAESYLAMIQIGIDSCHGADLLEAAVALDIERMGTEHLMKLTAPLDAKSCREIASRLETRDARREQWMNIVEQDQDWRQRFKPGIRYRLLHLYSSASTKELQQSVQQQFNGQVAKTRRLSIDFAAHAYELEHQQKPHSFADLVPDYLKAIPQDPLTGTNMTLPP